MTLDVSSGQDLAIPYNSATKTISTAIGVLVGFFGIEHGFFEVLQGNIKPTTAPLGFQVDALGFGYVIDAIGPNQKFWSGATEPAFTIIPNFLITGLLAIVIGIIVCIWSLKYLDKIHGVSIFFTLSIILFLFGGGFAPIVNAVICSLTATRINKPLNWWKNNIYNEKTDILARLWPLSGILAIVLGLFSVEIAILGFPFTIFLDSNTLVSFLLVIGNLVTLSMIFAIISAFIKDIQVYTKQNN